MSLTVCQGNIFTNWQSWFRKRKVYFCLFNEHFFNLLFANAYREFLCKNLDLLHDINISLSTIYIFTFSNIYFMHSSSFLNKIVKNGNDVSLCHKLKFLNSFIFTTWRGKPWISQTWIIWCSGSHNLNYLRSTTSSCKDIEIKIDFMAKTQFFWTR